MLKVFNACALCWLRLLPDGGSVVQQAMSVPVSVRALQIPFSAVLPGIFFLIDLYVEADAELITFRFLLALLTQPHKFQVAIPGRFRQFWRFSVSLCIETMRSLSHHQTKVP
jgi:hypothetical protein